MDYGLLFRRGWDIVVKNKWLLVLGFLAGLGGGGGSGGGSTNFSFPSGGSSSSPDFDLPPNFPDTFAGFWGQFGGLIIGLICLIFILAFVFWLLRLVGQAGMVNAVARLDVGEKVTLGDAFSQGVSRLGRMVGLNLVLYGPIFLVGLLVFTLAVSFIATGAGAAAVGLDEFGDPGIAEGLAGITGGLGICLALLACLMVPYGLWVTVVYPFAMRGLVLQNHGAVASVRHGWQVVKDNVGDVILLIIAFLVLGFLFGLATLIVLVPVGLVAFVPALLSIFQSGDFTLFSGLLLVGGGICFVLLATVIMSLLVTYRSTVVTLAYQEFVNKSAKLKPA